MEAIIHCGFFKTGTTSIQNTLYENKKYLLEKGVLYPSSGIDDKALKESSEIGYRHSKLAYMYGSPKYQQLLRSLVLELRNTKHDRLFLSAEPWSNPKTIRSLNTTIQELKKIGYKDVKGIVILRNIQDYMIKHYREWTRRHGSSLKINNYIISQNYYFDYLTICRNISQAFNGNVEFYSYDRITDARDPIFDKIKVKKENLKQPQNTNKGYSCFDAEISRIANTYRLKVEKMPYADALLDCFGLKPQNHLYSEKVSPEIKKTYNAEYAEKLSCVTGLTFETCQDLLKVSENTKTDIYKSTKILEAAFLEWLKLPQKEKEAHCD
ncbi:hypothetical protein [Chromohalobacter israelensis]|uniref:hypothetical protein n=1 Tax=Chromohalobacter israelensis TaxID=141390 RepID=UPI000FFE508F|nr:hypothetical protein [Chromohalobacter salexigens]